MLISLLVEVKKQRLFQLGADATVYVWGKPALDQDHQILRFTDVRSMWNRCGSAFGRRRAGRGALPANTLADQAVIDLKPFAEDAKKQMSAAVGGLAAQSPGISATAASTIFVWSVSPTTSKTLRMIADARRRVSVAISSLAGLK